MLATLRYRLLALILRTPLHPTVSRRFLLLRSVGETGLQTPVAVRYAEHEGELIAIGRPEAPWWRSLSTTPGPVCIRLKGRTVDLTAALVSGEALDEAVLRYLQKYPGEWKALGIAATADADDVQAAAHGVAVVVFSP
ncbi:hypothetical protein BH23ACT9_BH23ACT9_26140 [soil metagenome]